VQAVCLEEDAAKLLSNEQNETNYSLDRLGVPLVEIALEPVSTKPSEVKEIALTLGGLLRETKMVKRGIGSIRQDVNISVMDSGVVEVKGVQQLDQLEEIIDYEATRQHGLILIAEKLKKLSITITKEDMFDVTEILKNCESKIIQKALQSNAKIRAIRIRNFSGMFGFEPYPGIRLGKEIGQLVKFFGFGGVFHSDEQPHGFSDSDVDNVRKHLELTDADAFLIIAGEDSKLEYAIDSIIKRIQDATKGVPAETRAATQNGETVFLRPRPGASRMYPETDIPSISVMPEEIKDARDKAAETEAVAAAEVAARDKAIAEIKQKYGLKDQLANQIYDSRYSDVFLEIMDLCGDKMKWANYFANAFCSTLTYFEGEGLDTSKLTREVIIDSAKQLIAGQVGYDGMENLWKETMSDDIATLDGTRSQFSGPSDVALNKILDQLIQKNKDLPEVKAGGERAVKKLMGIFMKTYVKIMVVDGKEVHDLLSKKISEL
jgi:glutamyl-tRNA(Gln) amidotransferase subunit E